MTKEEKIKKRRAYLRQYARDYRKGKRNEDYICNLAQTEKKWEARHKRVKVLACGCLLTVFLLSFVGCSSKPKTLYESNSVSVVKEGNTITVQDRIAEQKYQYHIVRVRRSDGVSVPLKETETDTIKIVTLPAAGLWVQDKTAGRIFTYQRKFAQNKG